MSQLAYGDVSAQKEVVNVSVPIDVTTHRLIKTLAAMEGKNIRDIIKDCIEEFGWREKIVTTLPAEVGKLLRARTT